MVDINRINESIDKMMEALLLFKQAFRDGGDIAITTQSVGGAPNQAMTFEELKRQRRQQRLAKQGLGGGAITAQGNISAMSAMSQQNLNEYLGITNVSDEFELLNLALKSPKWPDAVNVNLICDPNSDQDKSERGKGIIELMIEEDLKELKFLDIGCGEGHTVCVAADYNPKMAVGYDPKSYPSWSTFPQKPNLLLTTSWDDVMNNGPYDVITIFDVLDHSMEEDPVAILEKTRAIMSDTGKIYLRCHPWISRHGTHLYHSLNKAYAHLIFTEEELKQIVPNPQFVEPSRKVTRPLLTYDEYIKLANLFVLSRREITEKPEPFFKISTLEQRICKNTKMSNFPEYQMSIQFVDYVLSKNKPDPNKVQTK